MISYAQNFEDVILHRAFGDLKNGFFVDVGAAHPVDDSVTCHFYEQGWTGINIEPDPRLFTQLEQARERDINLDCVVGDPAALGTTTTLNVVSNPGLTTLDNKTAHQYRKQGLEIAQVSIPVMRMDDILQKHACNREIHFMKIDVEGSEIGVIDTNDWMRFRPWIVIVEVVVSNTGANQRARESPGLTQSGEVDRVMTSHGYNASYFDGLNRFYVAEENGDLAAHIAIPPNVFDGFILAREAQCVNERSAYQAQAESAEQRLIDYSRNTHQEFERLKSESAASERELRAWAASLEARAASLEEQIRGMRASWRWKATHPRFRNRSQ
jgi:FkbM family methyltransferase